MDNHKKIVEEKIAYKNSPSHYLIVIGPLVFIALLCFIEMS